MAKWDLSKLPEGRKPLPDEWFAERAQMQDRIKGLEELLWAAENDANEAEAYAGELEAKLVKAVEALERIDEASNHYCMTPTYSEGTLRYAHKSTRNLARTTLAELTGGKDE